MQAPTRFDYVAVGAIWLVLVTTFVLLERTAPWTVLFGITGLLWLALPLTLTRFRARPLAAVSLATLSLGAVMYLTMVWAALMILGVLAPLFVEADKEVSGDLVAWRLAGHGLKFIAGAGVGILLGMTLRYMGSVDWVRRSRIAVDELRA